MSARSPLWLLGLFLIAQCARADGTSPVSPVLRLPNGIETWSEGGFQAMVGPLRLPTDPSERDTIQVWLKLPEDAPLTARWINDSRTDRYTLVYPPGTVADRVEYEKGAPGIDDVRGARIDGEGNTLFHDYESAPGTDPSWLYGYEWRRADDRADVEAGEALIRLFYPNGSAGAINHFRQLNHCGACHQEDAPSPRTTAPPFRFESDSRGFFQPITVLQDEMTVRSHRSRDLNADDPYVTVWCGDQQTHAISSGGARWYECPGGEAPLGKLDLLAALAAQDPHARQVCESRSYLYRHMDGAARAAFAPAFRECGIR